MVPYVTRKLFGCDVTMDEDAIIREALDPQELNMENDEALIPMTLSL